MARVEDGGQANTGSERLDDVKVDFVVDDVSCLLEVHRVDDFVVAVFFVAVDVFGLSAVARVVQEEGVVRLRASHEPLHCADHVRFRRVQWGVCGVVVGEDDHVFALVVVVLHQVLGEVGSVVDAPAQLGVCAVIVDAD